MDTVVPRTHSQGLSLDFPSFFSRRLRGMHRLERGRTCRVVMNWLLMLSLALFWVLPAQAQQPLTARSVVAAQDKLKQTYEVKNFRIGGSYDLADAKSWENGAQGGKTLESLGAAPARTSYIAVGTPKRDAKGEITNAIVVNAYYSGDATAMYTNWYQGQSGNAFSGGALVGPGLLFDTNRFYVIFLDALGQWGASKPSDGLGRKFPIYSYYDMVQLNYRLLRDHLKVGQVVLATGASMGATQSYYWGLMHPGFVKAVMPLGGATATDGEGQVAAWTFQLAKAALESDPVWVATQGDYYKLPKDKHPNKGVEFHWSMLSLTGYDLNYRQSLGWPAVSRDVFTWEADPSMGKDAGANLKNLANMFDAVDLWYRDTVGEIHNINKLLPGMKARTLVVHVDNDQWLTSDKARAAAQAIPGGQYVGFKSPIAHYAVFKAPNELKDNPIFDTFMRDIGVIEDKTIVCTGDELPHAERQHEARSAQIFLARRDGVTLPGQVRQGQGQARRRVGTGLHGRVLRQGQKPADPGGRAWQGRFRCTLWLPDQVRGRARLPRDCAGHAATGHLRAGQPGQADDAHPQRRA